MTKFNYSTLAACCFSILSLLNACQDDYDDTALWDAVNNHEERLAALEQWQEETNHNIAAIQQLLNTTDCITAVTSLMEGGKEVGYTISFLHSDPITIYHGEKGDKGDKGEQGDKGDKGDTGKQGVAGQDGADGYTPQIGLTQGSDGNWYWTLDGQLMLDKDNKPIRANGEDGKDGQDGADGEDGQDGTPGQDGQPGADGEDGKDAPTPQISLGSSIDNGTYYDNDGTKQTRPDNNAWYLSVDDGQTWYRITGDKGDKGNKGDEGDKGDTGEQGPQGETGDTGPQGPQGEQGEQGIQGEKGDSWFSQAPENNGSYWTFFLKGGDSFNVPAYQALTIGEDTGMLEVTVGESKEFKLTFDTPEDYIAIKAEITTDGGNTSIDTRADDAEGWSVVADLEKQTITVTAQKAGKAWLDVTLLRANGSKLTASRVLEAINLVTGGQTISAAGKYVMRGSYSQGITINGTGITVVLEGASMNITNDNHAINIQNGNPTIYILGTNKISVNENNFGAGIYVAEGSSVTITGTSVDDILEVTGGNASSGIGGYTSDDFECHSCGNITIENITVKAKSNPPTITGGYAAAIGACGDKTVGSIKINNAVVTAIGSGKNTGYVAAAIGGGMKSSTPVQTDFEITISGSRIYVTKGGSYASYIGVGGSMTRPAGYDVISTAKITNSTIYNESGTVITQ